MIALMVFPEAKTIPEGFLRHLRVRRPSLLRCLILRVVVTPLGHTHVSNTRVIQAMSPSNSTSPLCPSSLCFPPPFIWFFDLVGIFMLDVLHRMGTIVNVALREDASPEDRLQAMFQVKSRDFAAQLCNALYSKTEPNKTEPKQAALATVRVRSSRVKNRSRLWSCVTNTLSLLFRANPV